MKKQWKTKETDKESQSPERGYSPGEKVVCQVCDEEEGDGGILESNKTGWSQGPLLARDLRRRGQEPMSRRPFYRAGTSLLPAQRGPCRRTGKPFSSRYASFAPGSLTTDHCGCRHIVGRTTRSFRSSRHTYCVRGSLCSFDLFEAGTFSHCVGLSVSPASLGSGNNAP